MPTILDKVGGVINEIEGGTYPLWIWAPVAVLGLIVLRWLTRPEPYKGVPEPPCPSKLWGHFQSAHVTPAGRHWGRYFDVYGPSIKVNAPLGAGKMLVTADPATIHHVLTTNCYSYTKSTFTRPFVKRLIGEGLVWSEGDMHKLQRKQLVPAFSQEAVNLMGPIIRDVVERCSDKVGQLMDQGNGIVDIHDIVSKTTLDVFGRVALNLDFDCIEDGSPEIRRKWRAQSNTIIKPDGFKHIAVLRAFPWIANLPVPVIQAQGDVKAVVEPLAGDIIETARRNANASSIKGNDLLSMLLRTGEMTGNRLRDNISTFIVAGFDSTSASAVCSPYLSQLARNQRVQNKLREELLAFGREPTEKDLASMAAFPYFDAVIKETLRMYPVTDAERVALEDDVVPLKFPITKPDGSKITELHIRKGDSMVIPFICSNRLNLVWGDGDNFRPERWLDEKTMPPKDQLTQGWSNLVTFSEGPRLCIGVRLALLEMKIILFTLLRNYTFSLTSDKFEVNGYFFASLIPVVKGHEEKGAYMPLRVAHYEG
ncbi:unnamed protein product [Somion occarium]|uniref:Cytochrome P450 n=1 Tax=Somion occarium TaxID=3059160 RepID=A0ABP1DRQ2_9APHY